MPGAGSTALWRRQGRRDRRRRPAGDNGRSGARRAVGMNAGRSINAASRARKRNYLARRYASLYVSPPENHASSEAGAASRAQTCSRHVRLLLKAKCSDRDAKEIFDMYVKYLLYHNQKELACPTVMVAEAVPKECVREKCCAYLRDIGDARAQRPK